MSTIRREVSRVFNWIGYCCCSENVETLDMEQKIRDKCHELEETAKSSAQAAFDKWLAEQGLEIVMGVVRPMQKQVFTGAYTSVWDDCISVCTPCMVNLDTGSVFDIEMSSVQIDGNLTKEYVEVNGHRYTVVSKEEYDESWAATDVLWRE